MRVNRIDRLEGRVSLNEHGHGIGCQCPLCGGLSLKESNEVRAKFQKEMKRRVALNKTLEDKFGAGADADTAGMLLEAYREGRVTIAPKYGA